MSRYINLYNPHTDERINVYCKEEMCHTCEHKAMFEYPWRLPIKDRKEKKEFFQVPYCKIFSRWTKPYGIDALLPEPLEYDEENDCLRHEKCIRSEVHYPQKEDGNDS